jgi:hypothetical protein
MSGDTTGKISNAELATDWRRLHEMTDEEAHAAIADDPDLDPTDENFWKSARLVGRPSKASRSTARFQRTVTRVTIEAIWLHRYQTAIDKLQIAEAVGTDFFRVALSALLDARLVRLIRLLEQSSRTASFWYLYRAEPKIVNSAAERSGVDLDKFRKLSEKLRAVRNRTFMHIDRHEVFDPQRVYRDAAIQLEDLASACIKLREIMNEIYRLTFDKDFECDEYEGSDISILMRLRDAAEAEGLSRRALFSSTERPR